METPEQKSKRITKLINKTKQQQFLEINNPVFIQLEEELKKN